MNHWLTAVAFRGRLRIYENYTLPGYEAVVLSATDTEVRVASHNLFKGFIEKLPWDEFLREYVPAFDSTPATQTMFLRNTLRTIATRGPASVLLAIDNHRFVDTSLELITVTKPKKATPPAPAVVRLNYYKHSCIELERDERRVRYIPMTDTGFEVCEQGLEAFDREYPTVADYPPEKAAAVYARFAQHLGATEAALEALGRFTTISKKEYDMATAKPVTTAAKPAAKAAAAAGGAKEPKTTKAPAAPKEKRITVASRFQELIMEGKLTDEDIFKTVQKEFGLDDSKKTYVSWYRNYLTKRGKQPPAAKGEPLKAEKPAKADAKPEAKPAEPKAKPAAKKTAAKPAAETKADAAPPATKVVKRGPPPVVKKTTAKPAA